MIYLLTQDNCPKCENIKLLLQKAFNNKYQDDITVIHRQTNEAQFNDLAQKYQIRTTPALISSETELVLRDPNISNLEQFILSNK